MHQVNTWVSKEGIDGTGTWHELIGWDEIKTICHLKDDAGPKFPGLLTHTFSDDATCRATAGCS